MFEPGAECPGCNAKLTHDGCKECGWKPTPRKTAPTTSALVPSAYREVAERVRPDSSPDDPCGELGCCLRVRDHIEQAKRISSSPAWARRFGSTR